MMTCLFRPDPLRAAKIDQSARDALADSLAAVFAACAGDLSWDSAAQTALLAAVRRHRTPPALFAIYAELVEALSAENLDEAAVLLQLLLAINLRPPACGRVVTLDAGLLGAGLPAIYARVVDDDPTVPIHLAGLADAEFARGQSLYAATEVLVREAAPDLAAEIEIFAHEAVLVRDAGPENGNTRGFGGASTFYLWGAIVLNIERQSGRVSLAEAIAHEAGHAYLFGSTLGAPLVENNAAERFASPLRADLRPMDGLVHASFVLARMIFCQDRLLDSGRLDADESVAVLSARQLNHRLFLDSIAPIEKHARFTATGGPLWSAAREWVSSGCPA